MVVAVDGEESRRRSSVMKMVAIRSRSDEVVGCVQYGDKWGSRWHRVTTLAC